MPQVYGTITNTEPARLVCQLTSVMVTNRQAHTGSCRCNIQNRSGNPTGTGSSRTWHSFSVRASRGVLRAVGWRMKRGAVGGGQLCALCRLRGPRPITVNQ